MRRHPMFAMSLPLSFTSWCAACLCLFVGWLSFDGLVPRSQAYAQTPAKKREASPPVLRLGPMLFRAKDGKVKSIEQLNLQDLYRAAAFMYKQGKYKMAIALYQRTLTYFPNDRFRHAALYNLGLAYEDYRQYGYAIQQYRDVIKLVPQRKKLVRNALFRIAACEGQRQQWKAAFNTYDQLLQQDLPLIDRIDALAHAGESLYHLKRHPQAAPLLRLAVMLHVRNPKMRKTISYPAAMAQYYRAQIVSDQFQAQKFRLPQSQLKRDLELKAKTLLKAQGLYLQTIQLRHADWALAALHRIGELYEMMYSQMMRAPIPPELTPTQKQLYTDLLRKRLKILLEKALVVYERNLKLAGSIGIKDSDWQRKSRARFDHVLNFYTKHFGPPGRDLPQHAPGSQPASRPASRPVPTRSTQPVARPSSRPTTAPAQPPAVKR